MAQIVDVNGNPFLTDVVSQGVALSALNAAITVQLRGQATVGVQVLTIGTQTLAFEATIDNVNWFAVSGFAPGTGTPVVNTTTNGQWNIPVAGFFQFRVRCSIFTSAGAVVSIVAAQGTNLLTGLTRVDAINWAGTLLGVPTNFGTTPGAVVAGSVNSSVFIGTTVAVAASAGIQKVGIVGNAGSAAIFDAAIAAAAPANALQIAPKAASANPANATAGNLVALFADLAGRLVITPIAPRLLVKHQATTVAAAAETTIITAGAAGVFNDLIALLITTAGAAAQTIVVRDVTAAGTPWTIDYPNAAVAPGAPFHVEFPTPMQQGTAASAWTVTPSAATAIHVTALYAQRLG